MLDGPAGLAEPLDVTVNEAGLYLTSGDAGDDQRSGRFATVPCRLVLRRHYGDGNDGPVDYRDPNFDGADQNFCLLVLR